MATPPIWTKLVTNARLSQSVVSHGVGNCNRGHKEGYAQAVEQEERGEFHLCAGLHAVDTGTNHEETGQTVAKGKYFLGRHEPVGDDAHQGRHKDGHNTLHGKEPFDLRAQADIAQITAQGSQVSTPDGKLQEIHQNQAEGKIGILHLVSVFVLCRLYPYKFRNFTQIIINFEG